MRQSIAAGAIFERDDAGSTVIPPPGQGPGHWAGAPSAAYDAVERRFLLCYRLRRPVGAGRGYRCVVAASEDGLHFDPVWSFESSAWDTPSIERSALLADPAGGWRLYVSSVDPRDNRWRIDRLHAPRPEQFDPAARQEVMTAASTGTEGVKDPVPWIMGGLTWMLVPYGPATGADLADQHATGNLFATGRHPHPTALAVSDDGRRFRWLGDALVPGTSWDAGVARASAIVWADPLWLLFYDGRTGQGDIYEDRTGLAVSLNARDWEKVTVDASLLSSPWGSGSLRYLDVLPLPDRNFYYYECCRPDGSHELRVNVVEGP
jgi:hypothetical protein